MASNRRSKKVSSSRARTPKRLYTGIGNRIASLADQYDLAKALGISQQSVSKKLRGVSSVCVEDLKALSEHFGVPMLYFFAGGEPAEPPDPKVLRALEWTSKRGAFQDVVVRLSGLPVGSLQRVLDLAEQETSPRQCSPR